MEEDEGEMGHIAHFRGIIGLIEEGLIVMLAMKWKMKKVMRIIPMMIGIILISKGVARETK